MNMSIREPQRFADQVILVTGGGSGIGRATAQAFAAEGATVAVVGRNRESLQETADLIQDRGGKSSVVVADISRSADSRRMVEETVQNHGGLQVAFNNAGAFDALGPVAEIDEDSWARMLAVNVTGTWLSMKHEIRHMASAGGGVIINMSSSIGPHFTVPAMGAYGATKAAISSLTRTAAREYIGAGVRINAISPGPCDTPLSLLPGETKSGRAERLSTALPLGRVATLEEVAGSVLWLASPESGFAVGLDLLIDGGADA